MDLTVILVAALGLLAVLFLVRGRQQQYAGHVQQLQTKTRRTRELTIREWTRAEVALHATPDDCLLIIRDKADGKHKVYDVTEYIDDHPGGMSILNNAGADATEGFHGPQHPDTVFEMLRTYCVGELTDP